MARNTFLNPYSQFRDDTGQPVAAGTIDIFDNGTTDPINVYSDPDLTTAQTNPYVLDASGRIIGDLYFAGLASIRLKTSTGATIRTVDNNFCFDTFNSINDAVNSGVSQVTTFLHTTSLTPQVGIGTGIGWAVETSSGNNETGMTIDMVSTDITPGSEDFKAVFNLMSGGATASSVMELDANNLYPPNALNWGSGDVTVTYSAGQLAVAGGVLEIESFKGTGATTITNILDEDNMMSDSATALATQQSIKAYIDAFSTNMVLSERTSNTILGVSDNSNLICVTSGTFTQTFTAAATLGASWFLYYKNAGTGNITLDPNGSEEIDGLTSFVMYPGEARLIQCDGTKFTTVLMQAFSTTFTSSGTFVTPPGYSAFSGIAWGGGASGAGIIGGGSSAAGGGGGGCFPFTLNASLFGSSETITVGAGGTAVSSASGIAGGSTSVGSLIVVNGGGAASTTASAGGSVDVNGSSVIESGNTASFASSDAGSSTLYGGTAADITGTAGSSLWGGGAGGSLNAGSSAVAPGTSTHGGDGGIAVNDGGSGNAADGTAPGGGGGALKGGSGSSGAGARGELRIWGVV